MTSSTDALWERMRDALELLGKFEKRQSLWPDGPHVFAGATADALRAAASLRERLEAVERERDEARKAKESERGIMLDLQARAEKAEERVRELERDIKSLRNDRTMLLMRNSALQDKLLGIDCAAVLAATDTKGTP